MRINFEFDPYSSSFPWRWAIETNIVSIDDPPQELLSGGHYDLSDAMEQAQDAMALLTEWYSSQYTLTIS